MSLQNQTVQATYAANGSNQNFAIPFAFIPNNPTHIKVKTSAPDGTEVLVSPSDYTLSPNDVNPTTVVFDIAPLSGLTVLIYREMPFEQLLDYINTGAFQAEDHEKGMDFMTMLIQQLAQQLKKIPKMSQFSTLVDRTMAEPQEGYAIVGDAFGNIVNSSVDLESIATNTADIAQQLADAIAAKEAAEAAQAASEEALADITAIIGSLLTQTDHAFTGGQSATDLTDEIFDGGQYVMCTLSTYIRRGTTIMYRQSYDAFFDGTNWVIEPSTAGPADQSMPQHGVTLSFGTGTMGQLKLAATSGDDGEIIIKKTFFMAA